MTATILGVDHNMMHAFVNVLLIRSSTRIYFYIQLNMFVDTTLVHDSLTLDEIRELFFTVEEVST